MRVPSEKRNHAFAELFLRLPPLNAVLERFVRHGVSEVIDPDRSMYALVVGMLV